MTYKAEHGLIRLGAYEKAHISFRALLELNREVWYILQSLIRIFNNNYSDAIDNDLLLTHETFSPKFAQIPRLLIVRIGGGVGGSRVPYWLR